mmetsp:Transcript_6328/g.9747  ORF Transcript_6328/g.9747 Transcript_6328/m.9747 type:complete len:482 (+) Transcript_6328:157-1602(+)|eukprot:CAMPEP_0178917834 /NCGR_PEP_ID=MMETSP0786-20121207/13479_1 /TAXON_ID=186022 /ORGANISM="Thalassionema frauenfeldii, Strain CCMP 1798" /LENGTH=481 /DNA_ID=CAMNT_0020591453 /DNA_START=131 /DNA_END=1576 /DNA_ORIENTATION=-
MLENSSPPNLVGGSIFQKAFKESTHNSGSFTRSTFEGKTPASPSEVASFQHFFSNSTILQSLLGPGYCTVSKDHDKKRTVRFAKNLVSDVKILEGKTSEEKRDMFYSDKENEQILADISQTIFIAQQPDLNVEDFGESTRGLENEKSKETKKEILRYRKTYIETVVKEHRVLRNKKRWSSIGFSYDNDEGSLICDLSRRHTQFHREEAAVLGESDAFAAGIPVISSSHPLSSTDVSTNATIPTVTGDVTAALLLQRKDDSEKLPALSKEVVNRKILSDLEMAKEKMKDLHQIIQDGLFPENDLFWDLITFLRGCFPRVKDLVDYAATSNQDSLLSENTVMECLCMNDQLGKILRDIDICLGFIDADDESFAGDATKNNTHDTTTSISHSVDSCEQCSCVLKKEKNKNSFKKLEFKDEEASMEDNAHDTSTNRAHSIDSCEDLEGKNEEIRKQEEGKIEETFEPEERKTKVVCNLAQRHFDM